MSGIHDGAEDQQHSCDSSRACYTNVRCMEEINNEGFRYPISQVIGRRTKVAHHFPQQVQILG